MTTFSQAVAAEKSAEKTTTDNGMAAFVTSDSKLLDLFGFIGSARGKDMKREFFAAFSENEELSLRILLWARDVRGGAGERQQFRTLLRELEKTSPSAAEKIMHLVPVVGRADDLFVYKDPLNRSKALEFFAERLRAGDQLFGKWAPRHTSRSKANTDGKKRKLQDANDLREFMGLNAAEYRKLLVNTTDVVETKMSAKDWDAIDFSKLPSLASARYQQAFGKNAPSNYSAYIRELEKDDEDRDPKVKINAGAVYPYDVVKSVLKGNPAVANAQFKALPDYVGDASIFPMVDTSGSMSCAAASNVTCREVALSLGLYLSDRTNSDFKDMFMTFSARPKIEVLKGDLSTKMRQMDRADWNVNTDLGAAFRELLRVAKQNNVPSENMPGTILILSDMQFDQCMRNADNRAIEMIRGEYASNGYKMPRVVFWNLKAGLNRSSPVKVDERGTALVSGFSPAIMAGVLGADPEEFSPRAIMMKTIMNERYDFNA